MDDVVEQAGKKILAEMRPDAMAPGSEKWQQRKAAGTRVRILEAAMDCLVEKGYAGLSTTEVTARARVSRGAMHHHFPSRIALVTALIEFTCYQRMRFFVDSYLAA